MRKCLGWTDGQVHFLSTSGPLTVHLGTIGGHLRRHTYSLPKKLMFSKFVHVRVRKNGRTKKVTSKDPFRINARDLKIHILGDVYYYFGTNWFFDL